MLIKNLLYILQSEEYDVLRFLDFVYSHFNWFSFSQRQKLHYTKKIILLYLITFLLVWTSIFFIIFLIFYYNIALKFLLLLIFIIPILPLFLVLALFLIWPLEWYLKAKIIRKAKNILRKSQIIKIGITGSAGKTSAKEILSQILEKKFKVIKTPKNINTEIGIANFIIQRRKDFFRKDVFIVEIGAYKIGDIKKTAQMIGIDYSLLTSINETHLERFGSLARTKKAKFELLENTKIHSWINFSDENIRDYFTHYCFKNCTTITEEALKNIKLLTNFCGIGFELEGVKWKTKLLARHNLIIILMCVELAKKLGMNFLTIRDAIAEIKPMEHRLSVIRNKEKEIVILDDSYNGNIAGFKSGLAVLMRAQGRRVVLTPGLVELGKMSKKIHTKIAHWYINKVDLVLLIRSSGTKTMLEVFKRRGFLKFKVYANAHKAHSDLVNVLKKGDTILFQNDLPDKYL